MYTPVVVWSSLSRISVAKGSDDSSSDAMSRANWGWCWKARTERWSASVSFSRGV